MNDFNIPVSNVSISLFRERTGKAIRNLFGWLVRLPVLILDVPVFTFSAKVAPAEKQDMISRLQAGDIILTADKLFPVWQLIMKIFWNSDYTHVAIYEGNGRIIEATTFHPSGDGVARTDAEYFFSGYKKICILRPPYLSGKNRSDAVAFAVSQLGNPYDYTLNTDNSEAMYCSKLIAMSLLFSGISILPRRFWGCIWKPFYIPDDFIRIDGMVKVYNTSATCRKRILPCLLLIFCIALLFTRRLFSLFCF